MLRAYVGSKQSHSAQARVLLCHITRGVYEDSIIAAASRRGLSPMVCSEVHAAAHAIGILDGPIRLLILQRHPTKCKGFSQQTAEDYDPNFILK